MACSPTVATLSSPAARAAGTMPRDTARAATASRVTTFMRGILLPKNIDPTRQGGCRQAQGALCFSEDRVLPARSRHAAPCPPARRLAAAPAGGLRGDDREHQRTPGQVLPAQGQDRRAHRTDAVLAPRDAARGGRWPGTAPAGPLRGPDRGGDRRLGAHRGRLRARGERRGRDALRRARRRAHRAPAGGAPPPPPFVCCPGGASAPPPGGGAAGRAGPPPPPPRGSGAAASTPR